jgi:DNA-binding transcriptional ArsR family regulator
LQAIYQLYGTEHAASRNEQILRNQMVACIFATKRFRFGMRRDVFQAIADPTRRAILNKLAHEQLNINSVAENFDVSRTAIYKHIKILTECGLIHIHQQGRERYCEARLDRLSEVEEWVTQYKQFWELKLDALENYLNEIQTKSKKHEQGTNRRSKRKP